MIIETYNTELIIEALKITNLVIAKSPYDTPKNFSMIHLFPQKTLVIISPTYLAVQTYTSIHRYRVKHLQYNNIINHIEHQYSENNIKTLEDINHIVENELIHLLIEEPRKKLSEIILDQIQYSEDSENSEYSEYSEKMLRGA